MGNIYNRFWLLLLGMLMLSACLVRADVVSRITMPASDEIHCMYFDHQGLLWIGTSTGVKSYDGYRVRHAFVNQQQTCSQLCCDIMSLTEDKEHHLWAGTTNGLVRISLETGQVRTYHFPKESQSIVYALFTASDGTLYVGTDDGFSIYNKVKDSFSHINIDNAKALLPNGQLVRYKGYGVKDFVETSQGEIIIGTWKQGLWKYSPQTGKIRGYAPLNRANSAYALCMDRWQRLWIGTQGYGVQCVGKTEDYTLKTVFTMKSANSDLKHRIIYDILQDDKGRIQTAIGDTICMKIGPDGALWKATRNGVIVRVASPSNLFRNYVLGNVRSLFTQNGSQFFLGYGMEGLAWYDINTQLLLKNNQVPGFLSLPKDGFQTRITSMVRRWNGQFWAAAGDNGILVGYPDGTSRVCYPNQIPGVEDNVLALCESRRNHMLWIGQRKGISVLHPNGKGYPVYIIDKEFSTKGNFLVNHLMEDHLGRIWISSATNGVVCVKGTPPCSIKYQHYALPTPNVTACFEDSHHRLWAICSQGLFRLNERIHRFEPLTEAANLYGHQVLAINEDMDGALWLATDQALVRLWFSADGKASTTSFTKQDGLANTAFFPNATFKYGNRLFFGNQDGIVAFSPSNAFVQRSLPTPHLVVTDVMLNGTSYSDMDTLKARQVSANLPYATHQITIPALVRKFGVEFSLLCYGNQEETQYAYKLDGYNKEWQYVDGKQHQALFENVPSGTYQLHLRAADSRGTWYELPYTIAVRVCPPFYATWWAWLCYVVLACVVTWLVYDWLRMRREAQASRQMSNVLRSVSPSVENNPDGLFMQQALRVIHNHLGDSDFNRDVFASEMNMGLSALYKKLRNLTGLSVQTYISTVRLNAAREILNQEPDIRISELAYRVGFNTPKYFSQCFKKEFGMLPGEFAKQQS